MKNVLLLFGVNVFFYISDLKKKKKSSQKQTHKKIPTININKHVSSYSMSLQVLSHLGHGSCEHED